MLGTLVRVGSAATATVSGKSKAVSSHEAIGEHASAQLIAGLKFPNLPRIRRCSLLPLFEIVIADIGIKKADQVDCFASTDASMSVSSCEISAAERPFRQSAE